MAISVFMRFRSGRDAVMLYDNVISEMGRSAGALPPGEIYHIAAIVPNGMFVADLWESRDAFTAYAESKLIPLTAKRGLFSPEVEFGDVHAVVGGGMSSTRGTGVVAHLDGTVDELLRQYDLPNVPPGLIFQWVAKRPGGICITGHWASREECEAALRSAGLLQARLDFYDIYNSMDGRRVHA